MTSALEIIAQDNNRCGESPLWDTDRRLLFWTDIDSGLVYQFNPATGEKAILLRGHNVSALGLNRSGDLLLAGADGLFLQRISGERELIAREYDGEPLAFNEMIVGPGGRVYAGTMYWGAESRMLTPGRLFLIERDGAIRIVDEGIELANGMGFGPEDRTLYVTDSAARTIYAHDVDSATGSLENKRIFVRVPEEEGLPDGLTVDAEGYVWSAQWYGSQVVRYDPDGNVERRIAIPAQQVSSVGFGGDALTDLYITTAGDSWHSHLAPAGYDFDAPSIGGALYRLRLGISGKPEHRAQFP